MKKNSKTSTKESRSKARKESEKGKAIRSAPKRFVPMTPLRILNDHIPPLIRMRDGSFEVDTNVEFNHTIGSVVYTTPTATPRKQISGLKVISDTGDILYQEDSFGHPSRAAEMRLWFGSAPTAPHSRPPADVIVRNNGGLFEMTVDMELSLPRRHPRPHHPRPHKYRHPGRTGTHFQIEALRIYDSAGNLLYRNDTAEGYTIEIFIE